jgi:hypothetical protein
MHAASTRVHDPPPQPAKSSIPTSFRSILQHRQHLHVIQKTARPAMRQQQRYTSARCRTLVYKVNALPGKVIQRVEPPLPGTPVELVSPVRNQVSQSLQLRALLPGNTGNLVRPSRLPQPCPQIVKHLIRDINPTRFHLNTSLLAMDPDKREQDPQTISK